ncbi:MAG: phosphotransferase [Chloroflexota bacterium]|nr:phosphotransferase [Chloroflexota bacterium]MDE2911217.1 phosphotransferase [Chloroflexota bacterium]
MSQAATTKRLASLTAPRITELARAVTGDDKLEAASWEFEPLSGGFGSAVGGTALYRLTIVSATSQTCSLVLKILYERRDEAPSSPYYWKREYEAYRSGLLEDLPADTFSTPRIYDLNDFGNSCWIWMEDVEDCKDRWSLADFRNIAARLGRFNGAWLTRRAPPRFNWLSRNWHSAIAPGLADSFESLDQLLDTSLARRALPLEAQDEIMSIWRDRRLFQDTLAQLPRTLCHTDAFRRNILHRRGDVVLLDWALASVGAIGEELVCLVAVSLYYEGFSADYAEELDKTVFSAYVGGLRQAGWNGDAKLARLGFTCGMVLRGLAGVKQDLQLLRDQAGHTQLLRTHGMSNLQDIARLYADVRRFRLLKMAVEARDLLSA